MLSLSSRKLIIAQIISSLHPCQPAMPSSATAFQQIMLILKNWWQESLRALLVRGGLALTYDDNYLPHYYCRQGRSTCPFFFPLPKTPQQQHCLAMFSTGTYHLLPFDPRFGCDQCPTYAWKYCAKPEKHYQLETSRDSVRDFLQRRTIGVPIALSRLLEFEIQARGTPHLHILRQHMIPDEDVRTAF